MAILNSINNLIQFFSNYWTAIIIIIAAAIIVFKKIKNYLNSSKEEQLEIVKSQIQETILQLVTEAEIEWDEWEHTGSIKRAQVIAQIYGTYPILSKIIDQDTLIEWIDEVIDEALETLRSIIANSDIDESETYEDASECEISSDSEEAEDFTNEDENVESEVSDAEENSDSNESEVEVTEETEV